MTTRTFRVAAPCALLATTALASPALAASHPPRFTIVDPNGVDLTSGLPFISIDFGGIGSGEGALRLRATWAAGAGWLDNWSIGMFGVTAGNGQPTKTYVQFAGVSDVFTQSGSTFTADNRLGHLDEHAHL